MLFLTETEIAVNCFIFIQAFCLAVGGENKFAVEEFKSMVFSVIKL